MRRWKYHLMVAAGAVMLVGVFLAAAMIGARA